MGAIVGLGAALLALRPVGPLERLVGLMLLPARVVTPLGAISAPFAGASAGRSAGIQDGDTRILEETLSLKLERAVLRSAWPLDSAIPTGVVAVPGEVDARQGRLRDHIMVRVTDDTDIRLDHPVVAGDVYVGRVERIPHRQPPVDRPGFLTRWLRRVGLASPPPRPPRNVVEVALITGAKERVGGLVPRDQDGRPCRLVVGGLSPRRDRTWLAVHNPESRATRAGTVVVQEPLGRVNGFDSLAEGFVLGDLKYEVYQREGDNFLRSGLGIQPPVDFESGLNQVLVLTDTASAARGEVGRQGSLAATRAQREAAGTAAVPVLDAARWLPVRLFAFGDTAPWRSTARLNLGRRSGLTPGSAVVTGVRLVGRVSRSDESGSTVALVDDPGFAVDVLAQAVSDPDAEPLVLGQIRSLGRAGGAVRFEWQPEGSSLHGEWTARHAAGATVAPADGKQTEEEGPAIDVRLWTGSGMAGTPRGLLVGRTRLPLDLPKVAHMGQTTDGAVRLDLEDTGSASGDLFVHAGTARAARSNGDEEGPR